MHFTLFKVEMESNERKVKTDRCLRGSGSFLGLAVVIENVHQYVQTAGASRGR